MVDADNKVVIIDIDESRRVLFRQSLQNWYLETLDDFSNLISQLGSVEVNGEQQSNITTFTVGGVNYSFNATTSVISPDLEVE